MLESLLGWFTTREQNRRRFMRRRTPYVARIRSSSGHAPAIGVDASGGGVCLLIEKDPGADVFDIQMKLDDLNVVARIERVWHDSVTHRGRPAIRMGARFVGISADHWDAVVRWSRSLSVDEPNVAQAEILEIRMAPDDASRLLPKAVQDTMMEALTSRGRLVLPTDGMAPLVQYFYSGAVRRKESSYHRVTVESRLTLLEGPSESFRTTFLIDDQGNVFMQK